MLKTYDNKILLTVDCVVFGYNGKTIDILLIKRKLSPYKNCWALPGGFVRKNETLYQAALRELKEETSQTDIFLEQLYSFDKVDRDPRERVITIGYYALVNSQKRVAIGKTDAIEARWFEYKNMPHLAFDHEEIVKKAIERIRGKIVYQPIGFELLDKYFTLSELQNIYESILDKKLDKRNFRRKINSYKLLVDSDSYKEGKGRPAKLYYFNQKRYNKLQKKGFMFEL